MNLIDVRKVDFGEVLAMYKLVFGKEKNIEEEKLLLSANKKPLQWVYANIFADEIDEIIFGKGLQNKKNQPITIGYMKQQLLSKEMQENKKNKNIYSLIEQEKKYIRAGKTKPIILEQELLLHVNKQGEIKPERGYTCLNAQTHLLAYSNLNLGAVTIECYAAITSTLYKRIEKRQNETKQAQNN